MDPVVVLIVFGVLLLVYFLPSIVATNRGHHNTEAITVLNLLLGWTFLGWVVALVWALTATNRELEQDEQRHRRWKEELAAPRITASTPSAKNNDADFPDITGSVVKVFALAFLIIFIWVAKAVVYPNGLAAPGRLDPGIQRADPRPDPSSPAHSDPAVVCTLAANMQSAVARARDRGVPRERALAYNENSDLPAAMKSAEERAINSTYDAPNVTPREVTKMAYDACMSALNN